MKKAYTARTFRIESGKFAENVGQNPVAGQLMLANIVAARGALPIKIGDETIGGGGGSRAPGGGKDGVFAPARIANATDRPQNTPPGTPQTHPPRGTPR